VPAAETINLATTNKNDQANDRLETKIFNPKGKEIFTDETIYDKKNFGTSRGNEKTIKRLIENEGYGHFKVVYYVNEVYAGSTEVEIVPSN